MSASTRTIQQPLGFGQIGAALAVVALALMVAALVFFGSMGTAKTDVAPAAGAPPVTFTVSPGNTEVDRGSDLAVNVEVGGIDFAAPRDLSAKVKAKAELGGIQSNLPLEFAKTDGLAMGHSASGTIGQGDDSISLNTRMGSIHIRSQASELVGTEGRRREPRPEPRPEPEGEEVF